MQDESKWKSHDFYLCAVCLASGASLVSVKKTDSGFSVFTLDISPEQANQIITNHWNRKLKLPTKDVLEAVHQLKTRLYSGV